MKVWLSCPRMYQTALENTHKNSLMPITKCGQLLSRCQNSPEFLGVPQDPPSGSGIKRQTRFRVWAYFNSRAVNTFARAVQGGGADLDDKLGFTKGALSLSEDADEM